MMILKSNIHFTDTREPENVCLKHLQQYRVVQKIPAYFEAL